MSILSFARARPVLSTAGVAVLLALTMIVSGGWIIDYSLRRTSIPYLIASSGDDHTYLAANILRRRAISGSHTITVHIHLFGASTVRESFISADSVLSSSISSRLGIPVAFINFGSTAQNLRESLALVDNIRSPEACFNFVGISPLRFQFPAGAPNRFPLPSDALRRFDREHGLSRGVGERLSSYYHWTWLSRWWPVRIARIGDRNLDYVSKRHLEPRILPTSYLEAEWRRLAAKNAMIVQNLPLNLSLLEKIIETSHSKGCRTILFEQVHHPRLVEIQKPIERFYRAGLDTVLDKHDVTYVDYRNHLRFGEEDFADHLHLGQAGKRRFEAWFLRNMVRSDMISGSALDTRSIPNVRRG